MPIERLINTTASLRESARAEITAPQAGVEKEEEDISPKITACVAHIADSKEGKKTVLALRIQTPEGWVNKAKEISGIISLNQLNAAIKNWENW